MRERFTGMATCLDGVETQRGWRELIIDVHMYTFSVVRMLDAGSQLCTTMTLILWLYRDLLPVASR